MTIKDVKDRVKHLGESVARLTGLKNFGQYINKILTIDAFFLNEDRHTHNIAVLMNSKGEYDYCPIFDNGAGLLADTKMDYSMMEDTYKLMETVKAKTVSTSFNEQLEASEELFGENISFSFTQKDVEKILAINEDSNPICIYTKEERERVRDIIFAQMRKYRYLFK